MRPAHDEKRYLPSLNLLVRLNSTNRECRAFSFSLPLHSLPSHLPLSTHLTGLRLPYLTNSLSTYHPSHLYLKAKVPTYHTFLPAAPSLHYITSLFRHNLFLFIIIIITYSSYFLYPRLAPRTSSTLTQTSLSQCPS